MQNRQRVLWWLAAAVSLIVGLLLIWLGNHNGWFLVVLGMVYLGAMIGTAREPAAANPKLARWGLGITLLLVVIVVIVGAVLRG